MKYVDFDFAVGADGTVLLKPDSAIEPRFFFYWLQSAALHHLGYSRHYKLLTEQVVRFPNDRVEQRRLVAHIEGLTSRLEQAYQARQAAIAEADTLRQALWDTIFAEVPEELWQPIGTHAKIQGGYAFKSGWFTTSGIRLLRNQNVYHGTLEWLDTVYLPPERRSEFPAYEMNVGDVVISMDRPLISTGLKAARIRAEDLPCLLLQRVGRFQFKPGLLPDYLFHFVSSQAFMMHISGDGRSSAVPHISAKQIEGILIPLPSIDGQRRIVARLDTLAAKQAELHRLQTETETELAAFTPALLAKAFRGEL